MALSKFNYASSPALVISVAGCVWLLSCLGCQNLQPARSYQAKTDGLLLETEFAPDFASLKITVRNTSDHPIRIIDDVSDFSPFLHYSGPTEVRVEDRQGTLLSAAQPGADDDGWWSEIVMRSAMPITPDDYDTVGPGGFRRGEFHTANTMGALVKNPPDFNAWKNDKRIKLRVWVTYEAPDTTRKKLTLETDWIPGDRINDMPARPVQ